MAIRYGWLVLLVACSCLFSAAAHAEDKVLRIAFDKALPPFSSVESNGEVAGFNIELIRAIADHNGWEPVSP